MMMSRLLAVMLIVALAVSTAACGRKASPEPPPGSTFPRTYPTR
jgi:predicted small lipoprotein YifL